tara:strand:- start:225 stop:473 length:249 start_codon:yes stop_codon:yes gene_type:complete
MADYLKGIGKGVRKALGQISEREKELLKSLGKKSGKALGQISEREKELLGGKKAKKMAHGGKVTRSIDGRATKGLTRGSRRT